MSTLVSIPTGLRHLAQGCLADSATLGNVFHYFPQPHRGCIKGVCAGDFNPVGVDEFLEWFPRVARPSQPWAECCYPVGVNESHPVANLHESRTLAALRDALLPKLLSGELRAPAASKIVEA